MSEHAHIDKLSIYVWVFVALLAATLVTTFISFINLGPFNTIVALAIAAFKMMLVALFFMHVRHSPRLTQLVVLGGLLWLAILITLSMGDFVTRGWLPVPGH